MLDPRLSYIYTEFLKSPWSTQKAFSLFSVSSIIVQKCHKCKDRLYYTSKRRKSPHPGIIYVFLLKSIMVALSFYKHKHNLWVSKKTMRPPVLRDKRDKLLISQGETWASLISKYKDRDRTFCFILTVDSISCMMQYAPGLFLMTEAANLWRLLGFIEINKINCKN